MRLKKLKFSQFFTNFKSIFRVLGGKYPPYKSFSKVGQALWDSKNPINKKIAPCIRWLLPQMSTPIKNANFVIISLFPHLRHLPVTIESKCDHIHVFQVSLHDMTTCLGHNLITSLLNLTSNIGNFFALGQDADRGVTNLIFKVV